MQKAKVCKPIQTTCTHFGWCINSVWCEREHWNACIRKIHLEYWYGLWCTDCIRLRDWMTESNTQILCGIHTHCARHEMETCVCVFYMPIEFYLSFPWTTPPGARERNSALWRYWYRLYSISIYNRLRSPFNITLKHTIPTDRLPICTSTLISSWIGGVLPRFYIGCYTLKARVQNSI